ncbi:hypothetical protein RHGRI_012618 [Rhododendron griersonianum]|uniref:Uncharacterized protein n=1 Tax=Rhododendron griersonianum TaxID=479676 RepID=A0AAV6KR80_9ERIC|nr:hypothetical protein RHGRI_012618 [Rhododendron griersonianum]
MSRQADLGKIGMDGFAILEEYLRRNKKKPPPPPPPHPEAQPRRPTTFLRPVVHPIEDPWRFREVALPNQQTVDYPSFKLVIVGDGGTDIVEIGKDGFAILEEYYGRNKKKPPPHQEVQHRRPTPFLRPVVQPIQDPVFWRYRGAKSYEAVVITETKVVITETKHHNFGAYGRHFAQMAPQADYNHLVKVGLEGFAMVDEYFGPKRYQKQQQKYQQKQEPQMKQEVAPMKQGAIDRYEAANQYGGMAVLDYNLAKIGMESYTIGDEYYGRNKKKQLPPPPHQEVQHRRPTPFLRPVVQPIEDPVIWRYREAKIYEAAVITETKHYNFDAYGKHFAQMAPQSDYNHLVKVGLEGFAIVDKFFGPKRHQKQQQKYQQKQEPQMKQEVAIDSNKAAKQYGGCGF